MEESKGIFMVAECMQSNSVGIETGCTCINTTPCQFKVSA